MTRIGPSMQAAANCVAHNPGCAILPVAERVGPNGSRKYGYAAVHRAIKARIIVATARKGRYSLTVPAK